MHNWFAVAGAAAGTLGSIITSLSLSSVIRELNIARTGIETTAEAPASNHRHISVFRGFDKRYDRAVSFGNKLLCAGVLVLVAAFILQAVSNCMNA